ncbi:hypothetical protein QJ854_gp715 [Moumouvirus goulette]|uniref:Uncharacterized protein n=1 Tax=Moumouvirus goulette TaxID=1247379 RepID=M1PWD9_9VIRU|nr:hypothetical protein QJ854_gp715 [Moumouvirus goulette]AGF85067.1 hypothetical protein glt_00258 [Moumouvirus goulette]
MNVRRRCVNNDCAKNCGWKIVETDNEYVRNRKRCDEPVKPCCYQNNDNDYQGNDCQVYDPCNRNNNRNLQRTLVSVINPTGSILEIPVEFAPVPFAARATNAQIGVQQVIGNTIALTGWSDVIPDILDAFDNITGTYTAPEAGDYEFNLQLNFRTSVPLTVNDAGTNIPIVEIFDAASGLPIVGGSVNLPTATVQFTIPPLASGELPIEIETTSILSNGQVILNAIIPLTAGQQVRIRISSNGLVYNPIQEIVASPAFINFNPPASPTRLTIQKNQEYSSC